jgi:hypothetical protein
MSTDDLNSAQHSDAAPDAGAEPPETLKDPVRRRSWLLSKVLDSRPLDHALELARKAEMFVSGAHPEADSESFPKSADPSREQRTAAEPPDTRPRTQKRIALALSSDQRERLLERLATGGKNAQLAIEFGLSRQQVLRSQNGLRPRNCPASRSTEADKQHPGTIAADPRQAARTRTITTAPVGNHQPPNRTDRLFLRCTARFGFGCSSTQP